MDFEAYEKVTSGWVLHGKERMDAIKREVKVFSDWKLKSQVECLCCNKKFKIEETTAFVPYDKDKKDALILCKNYPDCKGTILDFFNPENVMNMGDGLFQVSITKMNL